MLYRFGKYFIAQDYLMNFRVSNITGSFLIAHQITVKYKNILKYFLMSKMWNFSAEVTNVRCCRKS